MRKKSLFVRLQYKRPVMQLEAMMEVAEIIARNTIEEGDCLLWTGRTSTGGVPRMGDKSLRRMVYDAAFGELADSLLASTNCGHSTCLTLSHLCAKTRGKVLRDTYATTDLALRRAVDSTIAARKTAKFSIEVAREIRSSDGTLDEMAERYGMDRSLAGRIRRGQAWKDASSPFAGLGARA